MKQIGFMILLVVAALVVGLAFPALAAGPKAPAAPVAAVPVIAAVGAMPEGHPHIREALEAMREARKHLEMAEHDFKGHRSRSLAHLQQAIREAEICMNMP